MANKRTPEELRLAAAALVLEAEKLENRAKREADNKPAKVKDVQELKEKIEELEKKIEALPAPIVVAPFTSPVPYYPDYRDWWVNPPLRVTFASPTWVGDTTADTYIGTSVESFGGVTNDDKSSTFTYGNSTLSITAC